MDQECLRGCCAHLAGQSHLYIYVFIYINLFTIYKVSTHSTSTNLRDPVDKPKQRGMMDTDVEGWDIHVLFRGGKRQ